MEHLVGEEVDLSQGPDDVRGQVGLRHVVDGVLDGAAEDVADAVDVVAHARDEGGEVEQVTPVRLLLRGYAHGVAVRPPVTLIADEKYLKFGFAKIGIAKVASYTVLTCTPTVRIGSRVAT